MSVFIISLYTVRKKNESNMTGIVILTENCYVISYENNNHEYYDMILE